MNPFMEVGKGSILEFNYDFWHPFFNFLINVHKRPIKGWRKSTEYTQEHIFIIYNIFPTKKKKKAACTKPICPLRPVKFCLLTYKKFVTSGAEFTSTKCININSCYVVYKIKLQHTFSRLKRVTIPARNWQPCFKMQCYWNKLCPELFHSRSIVISFNWP